MDVEVMLGPPATFARLIGLQVGPPYLSFLVGRTCPCK